MKTSALSLLAGVTALGFASGTQAADLIIDYAPVEPGIIAVSGDWDGVYVGIHGGYGWANTDVTDEFDMPEIDAYESAGWLLGLQAGANFQMDSLIVGIVGDVAWADITGESDFVDVDNDMMGTDVNWLASIRGKLGFGADAFMVYGTAGVAFAGVDTTLYDDWADDVFTNSDSRTGWVVGLGAEVMVADNVSVFGEALYHDFGSADHSWDGEDETATTSLNVSTVKVGVNFHF